MGTKLSSLEALITQHREEIDAQRSIVLSVLKGVHQARLFSSLIPQSVGGLGLDLKSHVENIQRLASLDASTAWCVNQAAVIAIQSLWLQKPVVHEIWSQPDVCVANGPPFDCQIRPDGDHYVLTGHWGFSSGCQHATLMTGAARMSGGNGKSWRIAFFDPSEVTFADNWQVPGLRGTGSFEFTCKNLKVPACRVANMAELPSIDEPITRIPSALLFALSFAGLTLGVAKGALDDALEVAEGKLPRYASLKLRDDGNVQRFIAQAMARWRSANAYLFDTIAQGWQEASSAEVIRDELRSAMRLAGTHVIRECAEVVDLAYKIVCSTGIYREHLIQRRFQDMHVITQHVQAREAHYNLVGRHLITHEYEKGPMS
jgi:alkylation response protein AidB-like acyl-CoA dehydrogenase